MVAAQETTLRGLLEGTKQYQVPLYQRTYSWRRAQFERLWEDLTTLADARGDDSNATHFIGSLVLAPSPANGPAGVSEFLVIDGQQRLTTLTILLAAIRDHRRDHEGPEHFERINEQYLINKWMSGDQRLKLLPTQADRESYRACIEAAPSAGGADSIGEAYRYFKSALVEADDPDDDLDIKRIEDAIISGLSLVSVTAQAGDNAHRIFESLNNTGLKLTQGDLLRNYLFMRMPTKADEVYHSVWFPMQNELNASELELLFWLDLVQRDPKAQQTETYARQQARLDLLTSEEQIKDEVSRFARLAKLLKLMLTPALESHHDVRRRLERLQQWETRTAYPVLLHLLDRRDSGDVTSDEIARAMLYLESFLVRRLLIGRATTNINRILLGAVTEIADQADPAQALQRYLSTGRKFYASDREVADALSTVPFYLNGRAKQRKLVLLWLEESYGSKEPVEPANLTIEHVMPHTPTPAWEAELAPDLRDDEQFVDVHRALEHTIGNLTLTGYNSVLSNSPFHTKKQHLASSGLRMNQEIAAQERWGRASILSRAEGLAERIARLWPAPVHVSEVPEAGPQWTRMAQAVSLIPAGAWTSYGDLAALIGSHAIAVGMRIASVPVENGHRVMQSSGTVSPGFRWYEPDRTDDPVDVLAAEGVEFEASGRASQAQRLTVDDLALLLGDDVDDLPGELEIPAGQDERLRESFGRQLSEGVSAAEAEAVLGIIAGWAAIGGEVTYGTASETSSFLFVRNSDDMIVRPTAIYPTGSVEINFQGLAKRPPFDDIRLRDALRNRLIKIEGVEISQARLALRPTINTKHLIPESAQRRFSEALAWVKGTVENPDAEMARVDDSIL